jgi:AcrR family transcriptional regulator
MVAARLPFRPARPLQKLTETGCSWRLSYSVVEFLPIGWQGTILTRKRASVTRKPATVAFRGKVARESPWKPSRERAREREVKRDAVILAAARAFKERGYHNTTLDDIAAYLNVTKPTIYYYLSNKEQILFECFRAGLGQITSALSELTDSKESGRDKLLLLMRRYASAMATEFGWCMVRVENQDLSPAMSKRIKALKSEIDQGIRKLIAAGMADGSIRRCDPKMTAFALAGALNWIGHWYRGGEPLTPEQIAGHFIELLDNGLRPR